MSQKWQEKEAKKRQNYIFWQSTVGNKNNKRKKLAYM